MKATKTETQSVDLTCIGSIVADYLFLIDKLPHLGQISLASEAALHLGGCAVNTSTVFARLGGRVQLMGKIGTDSLGNEILQELHQQGIITDTIKFSTLPTAITAALVSSGGERTFIYYPGANATLSVDDIDIQLLTKSKIVHFSDTFLLSSLDGEGTLFLLQQAKSHGCFTSIDISWDPQGRWLSLIKDCIPHTDFLFCNLPEAHALTGFLDPRQSSQLLLDYGCKTVIIKLGEKGSFIKGSSFSILTPALPVNAKDTTGAGDCYVAAFLFGYVNGWDYSEIGSFANAAGAACVESVGATSGIHSFSQVFSLMQSFDNKE